MDDTTDGETDGPTDQALRELLREEEHRRRVEERRRRGALHQQAAESLTLGHVLEQLAQAGATAVVATRHGPARTVVVAEAGRDHVVLRTAGTVRLVPTRAISFVRPLPVEGRRGGPEASRSDTTYAERLAELALRRLRVTVRTPSGDDASGLLVLVGRDVLVVAADDGADAFVALDAVTEVELAG